MHIQNCQFFLMFYNSQGWIVSGHKFPFMFLCYFWKNSARFFRVGFYIFLYHTDLMQNSPILSMLSILKCYAMRLIHLIQIIPLTYFQNDAKVTFNNADTIFYHFYFA